MIRWNKNCVCKPFDAETRVFKNKQVDTMTADALLLIPAARPSDTKFSVMYDEMGP